MGNHAALIRAQNSGKAILDRGRNHIVFDNGDGTRRAVFTIDPLHYGVTNDQEIDTAWTADAGAWQWKCITNDWQAHARSVFNAGTLVEFKIGTEWITVDPQSINWIDQNLSRQQIAIKQAVTGQVSDYRMYFPSGYGAGKHFEYIIHPKRLIKHFIIDHFLDLPTPTPTGGGLQFEAEFTLATSSNVDIYLDGVKWAKTNGVRVRSSNRIEFRNATTGAIIWYADAPIAFDSARNQVNCEYEVRRQGGPGNLFICVRVPYVWMQTAIYPIIIDPTFTDGYGGDVTTYKDTMMNPSASTLDYGYNPQITVSGFRVIIQFDVSSISSDVTINSAVMTLYCESEAEGTDKTIGSYRGLVEWYEGPYLNQTPGAGVNASTWSHRNYNGSVTWGAEGGLSGTDYNGSPSDTTIITGATASYDWDVATFVAGWVAGTNTNYGIWLIDADSGTDITSRKRFTSSDGSTAANRPKLVVTYSPAGGSAMPVIANIFRQMRN